MKELHIVITNMDEEIIDDFYCEGILGGIINYETEDMPGTLVGDIYETQVVHYGKVESYHYNDIADELAFSIKESKKTGRKIKNQKIIEAARVLVKTIKEK
ncbi:MAG: hypothetical protein ACOH15_05080 [Acetobacterium sp.]